ncbi:unnamed protein product [Dimorphilus gyrociliatus]|uniref:G-protein coupled receptors family 1 profile domain-containing protein n=1 Tax=Dimorphilus gyrociliatus TaxID=2664684 RepID=A0A7I8VMY2_9ANNE|nr:unnamed protein product [Dimorphilus gyrociliatus]
MDDWGKVQIAAEVLIAVLAIFGNGLVVLAIYRERTLQTVTNYLIASLAAADFAVGMIGIPCVIVNNYGLPRHYYACLLMNSTIVVCTQISIFSLVAIAIERFLAIKFPVIHRQKIGTKAAGLLIACSWIFGAIVGFVPLFGWNLGWSGTCAFVLLIDMNYMVYFNFFGFYLIPLVFLFIVYGYMFHVVRLKCSKGDKKSVITLKKESRAAKRIFIVLLLFASCWLPINILNSVTLFTGKVYIQLLIISILLSHANSCMNPFVYALINTKFNIAFKKALGIRKNSVSPTVVSTVS